MSRPGAGASSGRGGRGRGTFHANNSFSIDSPVAPPHRENVSHARGSFNKRLPAAANSVLRSYDAEARVSLPSEGRQNDVERYRHSRVKEEPQNEDNAGDFLATKTRADEAESENDAVVVLDEYTSDLNMIIDAPGFCSARPMSDAGFGYLWAGVRATHGVTEGRAGFEVLVGEAMPTALDATIEPCPNVLRCGWSVVEASLQLGEDENSFGFGGTAKASNNCRFHNYGIHYSAGDVVGCYVDFTDGPVVKIGFAVNGRFLGTAFQVPKDSLKGKPLFPHVLSKNQRFDVSFSQMLAPMNCVPVGRMRTRDGLVKGPSALESRNDCEVLMMIGLPGCGKTSWANKYRQTRLDKCYNILGTNNLIERMKVSGLKRNRNFNERWEALIKSCTECFNTLLRVASERKRNYILDQTNVFPTARKNKLKDFSGMICKAVVVVPGDPEFRRRCELKRKEEGIDVPENAVVQMKANFVLPEYIEKFSEVYYTDLGPKEAEQLVHQYNAESLSKGHEMTSGVKQFLKKNRSERNRVGFFDCIGTVLIDSGETSIKAEPPGVAAMNAALKALSGSASSVPDSVPVAVAAMNAALEAQKKKTQQHQHKPTAKCSPFEGTFKATETLHEFGQSATVDRESNVKREWTNVKSTSPIRELAHNPINAPSVRHGSGLLGSAPDTGPRSTLLDGRDHDQPQTNQADDGKAGNRRLLGSGLHKRRGIQAGGDAGPPKRNPLEEDVWCDRDRLNRDSGGWSGRRNFQFQGCGAHSPDELISRRQGIDQSSDSKSGKIIYESHDDGRLPFQPENENWKKPENLPVGRENNYSHCGWDGFSRAVKGNQKLEHEKEGYTRNPRWDPTNVTNYQGDETDRRSQKQDGLDDRGQRKQSLKLAADVNLKGDVDAVGNERFMKHRGYFTSPPAPQISSSSEQTSFSQRNISAVANVPRNDRKDELALNFRQGQDYFHQSQSADCSFSKFGGKRGSSGGDWQNYDSGRPSEDLWQTSQTQSSPPYENETTKATENASGWNKRAVSKPSDPRDSSIRYCKSAKQTFQRDGSYQGNQTFQRTDRYQGNQTVQRNDDYQRNQTLQQEVDNRGDQTFQCETGDQRKQTFQRTDRYKGNQTVQRNDDYQRNQTFQREVGNRGNQTFQCETGDRRQRTVQRNDGYQRNQTFQREVGDKGNQTFQCEIGDQRKQTFQRTDGYQGNHTFQRDGGNRGNQTVERRDGHQGNQAFQLGDAGVGNKTSKSSSHQHTPGYDHQSHHGLEQFRVGHSFHQRPDITTGPSNKSEFMGAIHRTSSDRREVPPVGGSKPDYPALLQYLQNYQKQMGGN